MEVLKKTGIATFAVALALLAFAAFTGTRSAQASGPYNGPYTPPCVQTQVVYTGQWQWTAYGWQWVSVPQTICTQYATFQYRQQYQYPVVYPQQFYSPVNSCYQPLPGGGVYNACAVNRYQYQYPYQYQYNNVGYRWW